MTRLAPAALLTALALVAFDGTDAAQKKNDAAPARSGEVRFNGAIVVPAGSHAAADVHSVASLPPGRIIRRGSANPEKRDPLRTVVVLPPRKAGVQVVLITYD
jgi:hypothetical protein